MGLWSIIEIISQPPTQDRLDATLTALRLLLFLLQLLYDQII
jgi:hypothetical protein